MFYNLNNAKLLGNNVQQVAVLRLFYAIFPRFTAKLLTINKL